MISARKINSSVVMSKKIIERICSYRMMISSLAIRFCDDNSKFNKEYSRDADFNYSSLKRFSKEIGISYSTLSDWIAVYQNNSKKSKIFYEADYGISPTEGINIIN